MQPRCFPNVLNTKLNQMISKKFVIATVAAFAVLFIADYLWFGVIFKTWVAVQLTPPLEDPSHPAMMLHALAELCFASLLAWIYPKGLVSGSAMSQGIKFGIVMGLVYQLPAAIHSTAVMWHSYTITCFFAGNGVVLGILAGITIAMVYGNTAEKTA